LHWINGPWPGRLAVAARPRGGDWLADEVASWKRQGVGAVLSLLTPQEEKDLELAEEAGLMELEGLIFSSFPIPDRQVPNSQSDIASLLEKASHTLANGSNLVIHCRQGLGRSGLVAACLLATAGLSPGAAVEMVSAARGVEIPETKEQRDWIDRYAAVFAGANNVSPPTFPCRRVR
jgi:protein-tyrosine phosphatase